MAQGLRNDKEFILDLMKINPNALQYASKDVTLEIVQNDNSAYKYVSERFKENKTIMCAAGLTIKEEQTDKALIDGIKKTLLLSHKRDEF